MKLIEDINNTVENKLEPQSCECEVECGEKSLKIFVSYTKENEECCICGVGFCSDGPFVSTDALPQEWKTCADECVKAKCCTNEVKEGFSFKYTPKTK